MHSSRLLHVRLLLFSLAETDQSQILVPNTSGAVYTSSDVLYPAILLAVHHITRQDNPSISPRCKLGHILTVTCLLWLLQS